MKQIRLSGSGGQGVITAAIIMAEAAVAEGKEAVQTQSYGPEARGGASKAEVIISDAPIYHPKVTNPDLLLAMTQQAADKYIKDLAADGILVIDEDLVPNPPVHAHLVRVPITRMAVEEVGKDLFANIIALGVVSKIANIVSLDAVREAVASRVPPATIEKNMEALELGFKAAE